MVNCRYCNRFRLTSTGGGRGAWLWSGGHTLSAAAKRKRKTWAAYTRDPRLLFPAVLSLLSA